MSPRTLVGRRAPDADTWLNDLQAEAPDLRGLPTLRLVARAAAAARVACWCAIGSREGDFDADDERVFSSFAASAASTIVTVQAVEAEKLQLSIEASERERHRWARELHDETLQELGALRVLLESPGGSEESQLVGRGAPARDRARRPRDSEPAGADHRAAAGRSRRSRRRRSHRGTGPAVERHGSASRSTSTSISPAEGDAGPARLPPRLEATIYRLVQEATNNAIKHAEPQRISVTVSRGDATVEVTVADDGKGFDPDAAERSFGLIGMQERVALSGGSLEIDSVPGRGTEVRAELALSEPTASRTRGPQADQPSRRTA